MKFFDTIKDAAKVIGSDVKEFAVKNAPTILTCVSIVGSASAIISAIKLTPVVEARIKEKEDGKLFDKQGNQICDPERYDTSLSLWEKLSIAVPVYWPVILLEGTSIAAAIGSNSVNLSRQAALLAAYTLSENNLKEYKEKTKEIVGPKKVEKIEESIKEKRMSEYKEDDVILTGYGNTLFYESLCGRYFKSSVQEVTSGILRFNQHMMSNDVPVNDLYSELHIPTTGAGEVLIFPGEENAEFLSTEFPAGKNDNGEPCLMIWIDTDDLKEPTGY